MRTNSYKMKLLTDLSFTPWGRNFDLSLLGIWRTTTKRTENIGKIKKLTKFCEIIVSQPKKHELFNKNNQYIQIRLFPTLCIFPAVPFFNWTCLYCDSLTRKQNKLIKYAIMTNNKRNLKMRSTKIKKQFVESKNVTDIYSKLTRTGFRLFLLRLHPMLREIR